MDEILGGTRCAQNAVVYFLQIIVVIESNNSYGILFRIAVSYLTTVAYVYEASNEVIENEIQELLIVVQIRVLKQHQEKWLQHVQRMDINRQPKQALQYKPKGRRNIGRPRNRWRDQLYFEDQGTG